MENQAETRAAAPFDPINADFSYTLPSYLYTSQEVHDQEQSAIFSRSWIFACHRSQVGLPGQYVRLDVGQEEILVVRDQAGVLRAFYNVCLHRAHTLVQDDAGKIALITCPYHAWTYRLDGTLAVARNGENVKAFDKCDFKLKEARVEDFGGLIFVCLDNSATSLALQAPDLLEALQTWCPELPNLKFSKRATWDIQSNWKTAIENFSECYHCSTAHPAFVDFVDMKTYSVTTHNIWNVHVSKTGPLENSPYDYAADDGRTPEYIGVFLWPNQTLWIMPGSGNIAVLCMLPTGAETCREVMDYYFMDPVPSPAEAESMAYLRDVLQPEDIRLCERVQKGLRSRSYEAGRLIVDHQRSGISEHGVHHFQQLYHQGMGL
jgi:phenylpropionate dioxygenase-like ring-hydroxylating dioxygenase large terminal subunit